MQNTSSCRDKDFSSSTINKGWSDYFFFFHSTHTVAHLNTSAQYKGAIIFTYEREHNNIDMTTVQVKNFTKPSYTFVLQKHFTEFIFTNLVKVVTSQQSQLEKKNFTIENRL